MLGGRRRHPWKTWRGFAQEAERDWRAPLWGAALERPHWTSLSSGRLCAMTTTTTGATTSSASSRPQCHRCARPVMASR